MPDLPDYYTQVSEIEAIAYSLTGGADAAKPAAPEVYDVYFATDTEKLWFCAADGAWGGYWIPDSIFDDHSARHEDGGADEISLAGLAGEPATLTTHKALTTGVHGVGAGAIVGTTLAQTLTNKTLTSPDINGGTVDGITSLTVANNVDIGDYNLRAKTLRCDVATGTAPLTVASTTVVTNLNADLLDAKHYSDIASEIDTDVATHAALTATHGVSGAIVGTTDSQTLTNKTLTSPTIQGTVGAGTGLTMPALTLGGTVTLNGQAFDAGSGNAKITSTGGGKGLEMEVTNDGVPGAYLIGYHLSTSPAADDNICSVFAYGRDLGAHLVQYGGMLFYIEDSTDSHADGKMAIHLLSNQSSNVCLTLSSLGQMWLDAGLEVGGDIDMNSNKVTELATPTAATDGASKGYVDTQDVAISYAEPTRVLDTVYQNSTKIRLVSVVMTFTGDAASNATAYAKTDSAETPTTVVSELDLTNPTDVETNLSFLFVVQPSHYYWVDTVVAGGGTVTLREWHEWDLH